MNIPWKLQRPSESVKEQSKPVRYKGASHMETKKITSQKELKYFLKTLFSTAHTQYPRVCFETLQNIYDAFHALKYSTTCCYHVIPYRTHAGILKDIQEINT